MSNYVLFAPTLTPLAKAYVSHYTIANKPDNTYFDTALGILFGSETIIFNTAPIVTAHYYDNTTVNFTVAQPATSTVGCADAGSASIKGALESYVLYANNNSYSMAYANFVFAIRTLIFYPSKYNVDYMINYMSRYSEDVFSWNNFFMCRGSNRSYESEKATAFYIAISPLLGEHNVSNPMQNILQYSDMSAISGIILTDYISAGV